MPQTAITKAQKKQAQAAVDSFHHHYSSAANWGERRWQQSLYPALLKPTRYAALMNQYASPEVAREAFTKAGLRDVDLKQIDLPASLSGSRSLLCYEKVASSADAENAPDLFPSPSVATVNGAPRLSHWNLDAASVVAAAMLDTQPGDSVLDLCAAPGGKSVTLAQQIWPHLHHGASTTSFTRRGCLHSNENDGARHKRLAFNLKAYLPLELFISGHAKVLQLDGAAPNAVHLLPNGANGYDRVLVDAPCSSERHIIHAQAKAQTSGHFADELVRWRPGSSKTLAKLQAALLITAIKAVKVGGRVVYATCSLDSVENDGVVEKALAQLAKDRTKGATMDVQIMHSALDDATTSFLEKWTEQTGYGRVALPDHQDNGRWGPLFFAIFTKTSG